MKKTIIGTFANYLQQFCVDIVTSFIDKKVEESGIIE